MSTQEKPTQNVIIGLYNNFTGINEWPVDAQNLTQIFGFIRITLAFVLSLTSTFFILYILDALGFKQASIVITVLLAIQLATDYPTGILADHVGQKWILTSAIIMLSIGMFLLAYATTFIDFIIIGAIIGISNGQQSGALESWYDNNYQKFDMPDDPEKKDYGYTMNRITAAQNFVMGITFIIGGILATALGRVDVFLIEAILGVFLTIIIIRYMRNLQKSIPVEKKELELKPNFSETLKGEISFLLGSKINIVFITGIALFQFSIVIWANLLLLPIYFGYSGTDNIAGLLRSTIFFIGVSLSIAISELTKKVDKKRMNLFYAIQSFGSFAGIALLLHFLPMKNEFSWIGIIVIILLFTITINFFGVFAGTLYRRVLLDLFPSEYRNSLYSAVPTLMGIISLYFLPLSGAVIEKNGLIAGVGMCGIFTAFGIIMMEIAMRRISQSEAIIENKQETLVITIAD